MTGFKIVVKMLVKMLTIVQLTIYSKTQNFYRQKNKTALKMLNNNMGYLERNTHFIQHDEEWQ